jgi:hypothetical protein
MASAVPRQENASMAERPRRLHRITVALLAFAALWCVVQFVLSLFVHVAVRPHPGTVSPPTRTYFQAFGPSEVVLTAIGLGVVALVGSLLHRRRSGGEPGAGIAAWAVSIAAAALGVIGFASLFGVAICLLLACTTVRRGRSRSVTKESPAILGAKQS